MNDLIVLVPTRGRPHNAARLVDAWRALTRPSTVLLFGVDSDDPSFDDYERVLPRSMIRVGEHRGLCATTNEMALEAAGQYRYVGSIGDDHIPRTEGWDRLVVEALESTPNAIVYADDLGQREGLATTVFMPTSIVTALGYMAPPTMEHLYIDNSWMELGRALGTLRYLPEVVIEHLHPAFGKAEWDSTYEGGNSDSVWDHDEAAFNYWRDNDLAAAVAKIKGC